MFKKHSELNEEHSVLRNTYDMALLGYEKNISNFLNKPLARSFKFLVSLLLRLFFSAYLLLIRRPLRLDHNKDLKIRFSYSLVSIIFSESNKHFGYINPVETRLVVFYAAKNGLLCQSRLLTVSKSRVRKQREIFRIRTSKE